MNFYSNLLLFHLSKDNKQANSRVNDFLLEHMFPTKKEKKIFHIDCSFTKKKVCYCRYHESELMPKEERAFYEATIGFLEDEFKGKDLKYFKEVADKKSFYKEKILNIQEPEDTKFYLNLFDDGAPSNRPQPPDVSPNKRIHTDTNSYVNVRQNGANIPNQEPLRDNFRGRKPEQEVMDQSQRNARKNVNGEDLELVCQFIKCRSATTDPENFLWCKKCKKTFHAKCCNPPLSKKIVERFPWYCNECKMCFNCKSNVDENRMIICDICDRAFHNDCINPKITEIPQGDWYCYDCKKCHACKKSLLHEPNFPNLEKNLWDDDYFLCGDCLKHFRNGENCPVCLSIIDDDEQGRKIACDRCNLWVHAECDGITDKQLKSKGKYVCPICRSKTQ